MEQLGRQRQHRPTAQFTVTGRQLTQYLVKCIRVRLVELAVVASGPERAFRSADRRPPHALVVTHCAGSLYRRGQRFIKPDDVGIPPTGLGTAHQQVVPIDQLCRVIVCLGPQRRSQQLSYLIVREHPLRFLGCG